jgi:hypothetical protein
MKQEASRAEVQDARLKPEIFFGSTTAVLQAERNCYFPVA